MEHDADWAAYFNTTRSRPPNPLLVQAIDHVDRRGAAIDIGAGALRNTRYLLEQGFSVTVIDRELQVAEEVASLHSNKIKCVISPFADFQFPADTYDLAAALYALPFTPPTTFTEVFSGMWQSLVPRGIFCGQLFGVRDGWHTNSTMTFHTETQARHLLAGAEIISFTEEERDGTTANGTPKHWHVFHIIAREKSA